MLLRSCWHGPDCSTTELPEHTGLRAGLEPATVRLGVDNRTRSGPQQIFVAVVVCGRVAESNRNGQANLDRSYR